MQENETLLYFYYWLYLNLFRKNNVYLSTSDVIEQITTNMSAQFQPSWQYEPGCKTKP